MIDSAFHPLLRLDMGPLHYFSVLGRALFTAQHLEANCRAIVGYLKLRMQLAKHESAALEDPQFQEVMMDLWAKTMGQHIKFLNGMRVSANEIAGRTVKQILEDAREARNEIAHDIAVGLTDLLGSELHQRINDIKTLVRKIATADKVVAVTIHMCNKDPLPTHDFLASYEDKVVAWVTEATFED